MTPQHCLVRLGQQEAGDCWRACLASIVDLPAHVVPNFADLHPDFDGMIQAAREWLAPRGLSIFRTYCSAGWELAELLDVFSRSNPGAPWILSGRSGADPDDNHAVVVLDGAIAHDPSGVGITGPVVHDTGAEGWWWIDVVCVGQKAVAAE